MRDKISPGDKAIIYQPGEFMMGSEENDSEKPVHRVKISKSFYLGIYSVIQHEWKEVMGSNPSSFKGNNLPVESISWYDVQEYINKLNRKEGTNKYRLPTEAEWEYAARAGTMTRYSFGDDESRLGDYAWYSENSGSMTHNVGQKKPNYGDSTTCMGTSGNGCKIICMMTITGLQQMEVHGKVEMARTASFAADAGASTTGAAGLQFATATTPEAAGLRFATTSAPITASSLAFAF